MTTSAEIAAALCEALRAALRLPPASVDARTPLTRYGLDSLIAVELATLAEERFGVELSVAALLGGATLDELLRDAGPARREWRLAASGAREGALSSGQARMCLAQAMEPESAAYNMCARVDLDGPLEVSRLAAALQSLVERHQILRTRYVRRGAAQLQIVEPVVAPLVVDVEDVAPDAVAARVAQEAALPFDLERGPVLRATLLRVAPARHVLILTLHHVAGDAWSMALIADELSALYAGDALPPLVAQYLDFALAEPQLHAVEQLARDRHYWQSQLADLEPFELPAERPRASRRGPGAQLNVTVDAELTAALRALGRAHGATLYMALVAAWQALLARESGRAQVSVATPVAQRPPGTESIVGLFLNTLVIKTEVRGSFASLLDDVKRTALGAFEHAALPYEELAAGRTLFSVMFALQTTRPAALRFPGIVTTTHEVPTGAARFDLALSLREDAGGLSGALEYDASLFDGPRMQRLVARFQRLLRAVVAEPHVDLADLPLLDTDELAQLDTWSRGAADVEPVFTPHAIAAQAHALPHALAIVADETLTYGELDARANRLAHLLCARAVAPEARVAIFLERSARLVVAKLATWRAGGAYVPIDPAYPDERVAFMIADSAAALVLTQRSLAHRLAPGTPHLLVDELADAPAIALPSRATTDHLAYVVYTSGSTGRPKGSAITHRALGQLVAWAVRELAIGPRDRASHVAGVGFDATLWELWPTLAAGASLHLPDDDTRLDPTALRDWLHARAISVAFLPTPLARLILELAPPAELRVMSVGGEKLPALPTAVPPFSVIDVYGPSECTIVSAFAWIYREGRVAATTTARGPAMGRAVAGSRLHILDERLRPVPVGVPGELYLGGECLARGYLGRPALTAERFVPNPFGVGARLYATGDRARWLGDGTVELLGRRDGQVKLRGLRVELGEIESLLCEQPGVRQAAAIVDEERRTVIAYLGGTADPATLLALLAERLPAYMVPSQLVVLPALPLTPNGKIDRRNLPRPIAAVAAPPRDALEQLIAGAFADVVGGGAFSVEDSFFARGGHSLLAAAVVAHLATRGVPVTLRDLFEEPTVAGLARRCRERPVATDREWRLAASGAREGALSSGQARMCLAQAMEPESAAYNMCARVDLDGPLDVSRLAAALQSLVERHQILRTRYVRRGAAQLQIVEPVVAPLVVDVEDVAPDAVAARVAQEAALPFDLERGPVLRATLLRVAPARHVLILTLHHVAGDAWSMALIADELSALYAGDALPPLVAQYLDFALAEPQLHAVEQLARDRHYWQSQLADLEPFELPAERPRASRRGPGAQLAVTLDAELTTALRTVARAHGATLYMALVAAWQALLARESGRAQVSVATPVAQRPPGTEAIVGLFLNTLVIKTEVRSSFASLLDDVKRTALGAFEHAALPYEELAAGRTLFSVMFALQTTRPAALRLPGIVTTTHEVPTGAARFDLALSLREDAGGLSGALEYDASLFDGPRMQRLVARFQRLLRAVVAEPHVDLADLPLLDTDELAQLDTWSRGAADVEPVFTPDAIAAQARALPHALAVVADETLTYGELDARANRLAHLLCARAVAPEARVAIFLERSARLVVAKLATWRAGGAYVPIDPAYPDERVAFMIADAAAALVLTQRSLAHRLAPGTPHLLVDELADAPAIALPSRAAPDHLAYVVYTSGSTGRPKGSAITHRALGHLVAWHVGAYALGPHDRCAQLAGLGFDATVWELWPTLAAGASLHLPDDDTRLDPTVLRDWLLDRAITVAFAPTPLAEALLDQPWPSPAPLRVLLTGADRLLRRPRAGLPFALVNHYGPSECTVVTTCAPVAVDGVGAPAIGRPIAGARVHVLDERLRRVSVGAPGELYIGGALLSRGYLGRPALTAERFLPDPWGEPGARLYATGDRVCWLPDGNLAFLGRRDGQVKIGGVRVELGEVEAVLREQPGVREAVVALRGERRLVAWYVGDADAAQLAERLAARLPAAMRPVQYVSLPSLPRTANGKIDGARLPEPAPRAVAPASTPLEQRLVDAWQRVLEQAPIGIHDSFFALGGHSLKAAQIVAHLAADGFELRVRDLYEASTIAELAARCRTRTAPPPPIAPCPPADDYAVSHAQRRLWILDQFKEHSAAYNIAAAYELTGAFDRDVFAQALTELMMRHESLRTSFVSRDGEPRQRVAAEVELPLRFVDLRGMTHARDEARQLAIAEVNTPFDLTRAPLFRVLLLALAPDEHVLVITLHHIIADGWSAGLALDELKRVYNRRRHGDASELPGLPVQYRDYSAWLNRRLAAGELVAARAWWLEQLSGADYLELPIDKARPPLQTFNGRRHELIIPAALTAQLKALARDAGTTLFTVLLATLDVLLHRYTGQRSITVGTPIAGREHPDLFSLVGFFVNTLALRAELDPERSFAELLAQLTDTTLRAYEHQAYPFDLLVDDLDLERDLSRPPLFNVMLAHNNTDTAEPELALDGVAMRALEIDELNMSKFELILFVDEQAGGLRCRLEYNSDLFADATTRRWLCNFERLLERLPAERDRPLRELEFLDADERAAIVERFNRTARPRPPTSLQQLFEAQAARTPEAPAVVHDGATLTYAALNAAANQLAHRLMRDEGVAPGTLVALVLERAFTLPIAVLAAIKAGGAYVAVDPTYPPARVAEMLSDSATPLVITDRPRPDLLAGHTGRVLDLSLPTDEADADNPPSRHAPADPLYAIYTSGSTGVPNGALLSHEQLVNLMRWHHEESGIPGASRCLQFTSLSFCVSFQEIFATLTGGGTLYLIDEIERRDIDYLLRFLVAQRIQVLYLPFSYLNLIFNETRHWEQAGALALEHVVTAGEQLKISAGLRDFLRAHPEVRLHNHYGSSETHVVTSWSLGAEDASDGGIPPIGRPIANTRILVLDDHEALAPLGAWGELCVDAAAPQLGYLHKPELTDAKLRPHPLADGRRLYHTGDVGRWTADGTLALRGRKDAQLKVRGFRIDPAEVERVLLGVPGVELAVVVGRPDARGQLALYAYVVLAERLTPGELRELLKERLPAHMVPSLVPLPALPLMPNGKIDRARLPEPAQRDAGAATAPRTPLETQLAAIWRVVLGDVPFGVDDEFFEIGGHSLKATQIVSRIAAELEVTVTLKDMFQEPTIARMAALVTRRREATEADAPLLARVESVLRALDELSDDEARALAAGRGRR